MKDETKCISTVWRQPEGRVGVEVGKGELNGEKKVLTLGGEHTRQDADDVLFIFNFFLFFY